MLGRHTHAGDVITDEEIARLRALSASATPPPWQSMVEGRDHVSGDNFIRVGTEGAWAEDMYVMRGSRPASIADHDLIAAMRTGIDALLDEITRLRAQS